MTSPTRADRSSPTRSIEANVPTDITGGTLVARPVDRQGGEPLRPLRHHDPAGERAAAAAGYPSGTFSQLYLAVSHDHCQTFTDHTVFDGSKMGTNTVQFGDIFNDLAIDGAGNLYAVGAGAVGTTAFPTTTNIYLLKSTDHGVHWSAPQLLDKTNAAHMLPAAVGGPQAGQLAIGYFRTTNGVTDPNSLSGQWTYTTAETTNATAGAPSFSYSDVNPGFIYHHGQICNAGVLCGADAQRAERPLAARLHLGGARLAWLSALHLCRQPERARRPLTRSTQHLQLRHPPARPGASPRRPVRR